MKTILSLVLLCLTFLSAASVQAASEDVQPSNFLPPSERAVDRRGADRDVQIEAQISRDQASEYARQYAPGRVLNIRRDGQNWRVRVDQDGSVSDVLVNAESGRVSRDSDD
jgi:uncharacterized membrane protein YkoI